MADALIGSTRLADDTVPVRTLGRFGVSHGLRVAALSMCALTASAFASNWHYVGGSRVDGADTDNFFDSESVTHPTQALARVWVIGVRTDVGTQYARDHQKAMIEKAARRLVTEPPVFLTIPSIAARYPSKDEQKNAAVEIAVREAVANEASPVLAARLYFEFDCQQRMFRALSVDMFDRKGTMQKSGTSPNAQFHFVAPDTTADWILTVVCPASTK